MKFFESNYDDYSNDEDYKLQVKRKAEDIEDDFTDSRVVELWDLAQAKRFSKEELESIKVCIVC